MNFDEEEKEKKNVTRAKPCSLCPHMSPSWGGNAKASQILSQKVTFDHQTDWMCRPKDIGIVHALIKCIYILETFF